MCTSFMQTGSETWSNIGEILIHIETFNVSGPNNNEKGKASSQFEK